MLEFIVSVIWAPGGATNTDQRWIFQDIEEASLQMTASRFGYCYLLHLQSYGNTETKRAPSFAQSPRHPPPWERERLLAARCVGLGKSNRGA